MFPLTEILNNWELSDAALDRCEKYYLLHWEGRWARILYHQGIGVIHHQGVDYYPIFKECSPQQAFESQRVAMSFRKPTQSDYGYVMIKILVH